MFFLVTDLSNQEPKTATATDANGVRSIVFHITGCNLDSKQAYDAALSMNPGDSFCMPFFEVHCKSSFESYSLLIVGARKYHMNFDSVEALKEELSQHLSLSESSSGILRRLTDFTGKKPNENGYAENKWRNFTVCAYPYED